MATKPRDFAILGANPFIGDYVMLGVCPSGKTLDRLIIGDNAIIRSHSVIYAGTKIGNDFQTGHGVLIREGNIIGDNVSIGSHTVIERENQIGDATRIHSNCFIPEFVIMEEKVWIGPCVTILNILHPPCPRFEDCAKSVHIKKRVPLSSITKSLKEIKINFSQAQRHPDFFYQ